MTDRVPGRNDPCPCGSGKKYKKCCMGRERTGTSNSDTADVFDELRQAIEGQKFSSIQEAQAFADLFMQKHNQEPIEAFHGISREQMHRILYSPFTSPQIVSFPDRLDTTPSAPILSLFSMLVDAIGDKGMKPTAKGNLPRNFCREAAMSYWGEETYLENTLFCGINREEDFFEMHITRIIAGIAGLVRKYKGRFMLSRNCRSLMSKMGLAGIYPRLFRAYVEKFNWGYCDRYPDIFFIRHSFLFTLYLLKRYGGTWHPQTFYEDCFLRAFPMLLDHVEPTPFYTPEQEIRSCYTLRAMKRFARFLGLAEVEALIKKPYEKECRIRKLPLLEDAVRFHL
ncbi:MAG: SEC-C domain-containing protein [Deltaproteobacteria bacterium]|nr:SEC-C domain-containing protein [Deltaproteobacteria bacterium]